MKKVLSFVLVLAMILGSVSMAFAGSLSYTVTKTNTAVPFADAETNVAATVLRDLGALSGDENGKANPDANLTRAEAAALVVKAMGLGDLGAVKTATKFKDVPKDYWGSGYIAVASQQGWIDGVGNNTYDPEGALEVDQALCLVAKLLGYSMDHVQGTWPTSYRTVASALGLTKNVGTGEEAATRAQVFEVLYNALDVPMVRWNKILEQFTYDENAYSTIFKTLNQDKKNSAKEVAELYATADAIFGVNTPDFDNGYKPSEDLTGKYVEMLTKGGNPIGVSKVASTTLVGKFVDTTHFKDVDDKKYTIDLTTTYASLQNHQFTNGITSTAVNTFTADAEGALTAVNTATQVALEVKLDTTGKKIVAIYSATADLAADSFMATEAHVKAIAAAMENKVKKTSVNLFGSYVFPVTKSGVYYTPQTSKFVVEGDVETLSDIQKDDVVTLYVSGGDNTTVNKVIKVVVTRNTVEGKVTRIQNDKYTVNGVAYAYAKDTKVTDKPEAADVKTGASFKFYLDEDGKFFYSKRLDSVAATTKTAFILNEYQATNVLVNNGTSTNKYSVELYNLDGTVATYDFATTVATDGVIFDTAWKANTIGKAVDYKLDTDGKINYLKTSTVVSGTVTARAFEKYVTIDNGTATKAYNYGDLTVIFTDGTVANTKATYYVQGTLADLVGYDWSNAMYGTKDGKVNVIVAAKNANTSSKNDDSTVYGFISNYGIDEAGKVEVTAVVNGETVVYGTTKGALTVAYDKFYAITLLNGKIDSVDEYTTGDAVANAVNMVLGTPAAVKFGDCTITVASDAATSATSSPTAIATDEIMSGAGVTLMISENAVYYTLVPAEGAVKAHYEVGGDIYSIGNASNVTLFDLDKDASGKYVNDTVYDVVLVELQVVDE